MPVYVLFASIACVAIHINLLIVFFSKCVCGSKRKRTMYKEKMVKKKKVDAEGSDADDAPERDQRNSLRHPFEENVCEEYHRREKMKKKRKILCKVAYKMYERKKSVCVNAKRLPTGSSLLHFPPPYGIVNIM